MEENKVKLTPGQIENWRSALFYVFGAYAFAMPVERIQQYRDAMQCEIKRQDASAPKRKYKR